jgi:hypothetical protein
MPASTALGVSSERQWSWWDWTIWYAVLQTVFSHDDLVWQSLAASDKTANAYVLSGS